jgi:capsular polysaccharide biosynthesis protein
MENNKSNLLKMLNIRLITIIVIGSTASFLAVYLLSSSIFFTPLYRSEAIVYAPVTLVSQHNAQQGIGFGNNVEIDAYIQILKSNRVLDSINQRYSAIEHLGLCPLQLGDISRFHQRMASRINVQKTRYGSISISVKDSDAVFASSIANAIVEFGDIIKEDIFLENRLLTYRLYKKIYEEQQIEVDNLAQEIYLLETKLKSERLKTQEDFKRIYQTYSDEVSKLNDLKRNYNSLRLSLESGLPKAYIISSATPSHTPFWPPRLLLSFAAAIIFGVLTLFFHVVKTHN